MTLRRGVLYAGGASLLVAWFSSAASVSRETGATAAAPPAAAAAVATANLAATVQEQGRRLRARLATAPEPQPAQRNPFAFRAAAVRPQKRAAPAEQPAASAAPLALTEPVLELVGIAEKIGAESPVRTAMIGTAADEMLLVVVGDTVLGRYRVTAISQDTAELVELETAQVRRLSLR